MGYPGLAQDGQVKPAVGASINEQDQLGQGLYLSAPLWEGSGGIVYSPEGFEFLTGTFNAGAAAPTWAGGLGGYALQFVAANSQQLAWNNQGLAPPWTFAIRVNQSSTNTGYRTLFTQAGTGPGFWLNAGKLDLFGSSADHLANTTIPTNTWVDLCATCDGTTTRFYYQGLADGTASFAPTLSLNSTTGGHGGEYYDGLIEYLWLWSRVLTAQEVMDLHYAPYRWFLPSSVWDFYQASAVVSSLRLLPLMGCGR